MTLRNRTIALWVVISRKWDTGDRRKVRFAPANDGSFPHGAASGMAYVIWGCQLAVIHSMRQPIFYGRFTGYLPNRRIRIPLAHGACEGVSFEEVIEAWNP